MLLLRLSSIFLLAGATAALAQETASPPSRSDKTDLSWTDWADLSLASPVVIRGTVNRVDRLSKREAPDVPADEVRALVRADLSAALTSPVVLPAEAAWRWQGRADSKGKAPFGKGADLLLFGSALSGGTNPAVQPIQLTGRSGQRPWSAEADAIVRDVLKQALAPGARGLMVTGVRDAFFSEGEVAGASESQFFLRTEGGAPLTLVVRRDPARPVQVLVATGELVDRAQPPRQRTLLWRGLACGMPVRLPPALGATQALATDWATARRVIGDCGRTIPLS